MDAQLSKKTRSAPCHKAKSVMNWFHTKNVTMLKWAGNSPDLNPIEILQTLIKKKSFYIKSDNFG